MSATEPLFSLVVLVSGNGSNLQSILRAIEQGQLNATIALVISNRFDAKALVHAKQAGITTFTLDHKAFVDRESFDRALAQKIDTYAPNLVVLAGYMRLLSDGFVQHYLGKLVNIHPSLLPKYKGLNTHQRVIEAKDPWHGATVHYVVPELDAGPGIAQVKIPVLNTDTAESLAKRLLEQEHQLYPYALKLLTDGRCKLVDGRIWIDGQSAKSPLILETTVGKSKP